MSGIGRHVEYAQNYVAQLTAQQAREVARESAFSAAKNAKSAKTEGGEVTEQEANLFCDLCVLCGKKQP